MTRRLTTVVYDLNPDPEVEDYHGGATFDVDAVDRQRVARPVKVSMRTWRSHRYRLRPLASGYCPLVTGELLFQPPRGGALVVEWAAIELAYDAPAGSTVEARLHDGSDSYRWDVFGPAWRRTVAPSWNTPTEVEENFHLFSSFYPEVTQLGVEWRLTTTDRRVTPYVYGAVVAARIMFAARSGATASSTRSDGWRDDLVHRVLIPWLKTAAVERTDESVADGQLSVIDYAAGLADNPGYIVTAPTAVYDLDSDPLMRSPLAGTWSAGAKTFTLATPLPDGTRWAARVDVEPEVAYQGDRDLFLDSVPQIVIEDVDLVSDVTVGQGDVLVRSISAGSALRVPGPRRREYRVTLLLQSDGQVSALQVADAVDRLTAGVGASLVSGGTGLPVLVRQWRETRPARGDGNLAGAGRMVLRLVTDEYHGEEDTATLLAEDGLQATVGPTLVVAT